MEFENLINLPEEKKKEILSELIVDDVSYLKKVMILMAMVSEDDDNELLDLIVEHKIEEINLANKKYNLAIKSNENDDVEQKKYVSAMEKIINGNNEGKYGKACEEVLEILKHVPAEYYDRINKNFIERIDKNADKTHNISIDKETSYEDLDLLEDAKEIISLICVKYWNIGGQIVDIKEIFNK